MRPAPASPVRRYAPTVRRPALSLTRRVPARGIGGVFPAADRRGPGPEPFQLERLGLAPVRRAGEFSRLAPRSPLRAGIEDTLWFVVGTVPISTFLGFLLAVAVHAKWFVGRTIARSLFFLPTVISIVAIGFVWRWLLNDQGGLVPAFIRDRHRASAQPASGGRLAAGFDHRRPDLAGRGILHGAVPRGTLQREREPVRGGGGGRGGPLAGAAPRHLAGIAPTTVFLLVTGVIGAVQVFDVVWGLTAGTSPTPATC